MNKSQFGLSMGQYAMHKTDKKRLHNKSNDMDARAHIRVIIGRMAIDNRVYLHLWKGKYKEKQDRLTIHGKNNNYIIPNRRFNEEQIPNMHDVRV